MNKLRDYHNTPQRHINQRKTAQKSIAIWKPVWILEAMPHFVQRNIIETDRK